MSVQASLQLVYRVFRTVLYPIVAVLSLIPILRRRPYLVVATNAMLLLWLLGETTSIRSLTGTFVTGSLHAAGFGLALLFGTIGPRAENELATRKTRMTDTVSSRLDIMIAVGVGFLLTLAFLAPRIVPTEEDLSPIPILLAITFAALAARHVYRQRDWLTTILESIWASGIVLFYAPVLARADNRSTFTYMATVAVSIVLGYVFYDYALRAAHGPSRVGLLLGLALVLFYFVTTVLLGHRFTSAAIDRSLRLFATVTAIIIGTAYWLLLSGRRPRWPWGP